MDSANIDTLEVFRAAVALDLTTLAVVHNAELDDTLLARLRLNAFPQVLGLRLNSEAGQGALAAMDWAMADLPLPLPASMADELAADYAAIYLTYAYRASPCESVWLDQEGLGMQAPMFQVRELYRQFDLAVANWRMRPDDHLVVELHFLACLMQDQHPQALREAARFLDEHLLRWLPMFARRVSARCATAFYAAAARLTAVYCDELRDVLAGLLSYPRPSPEEVEARMQPRPDESIESLRYLPGIAPSW